MRLAPALEQELARDSTQRRRLIVELIAYLQHRQASTGVSVTQYARQTTARATAYERRHNDVMARLARIDGRLKRLDAQVDVLRFIIETLRVPPIQPPLVPVNGTVAMDM